MGLPQEPYGEAIWQSHMAKPNGKAILAAAAAAALRLRLSMETSSQKFDPEEWHV